MMKNKEKPVKERKIRKNPLELFFGLGDKVTKGDPKRKADFDYYMVWIIFLAFFSIGIDRFINFFTTWSITALGWAIVMVCILWFQYGNLKLQWETRKMQKKMDKTATDKFEDFKDMMNGN